MYGWACDLGHACSAGVVCVQRGVHAEMELVSIREGVSLCDLEATFLYMLQIPPDTFLFLGPGGTAQ